jgi:CMP-N,N'-diacetyllegionaminic acid synthase
MTKFDNYTAIIPAREGSKGIVKKNLINCFSKPLVHWTLISAIKAGIPRIILSSDSTDILESCKGFNNVELSLRPKDLAQDETSTEDVISYLIKSSKIRTENIILLQPTSPCRDYINIVDSIKFFENDLNSTSLISVQNGNSKILKSFLLNDENYALGIHNNSFPFQRRQELPEVFESNGAIYISKTKKFIKLNSFFCSNATQLFNMSLKDSIDIDNLEDLKKAEEVLREKDNNYTL